MSFDFQLWMFEDVRGTLREIQECPILQLEQLKSYLELLSGSVGNQPLEHLYLNSSLVRQLCDRILSLVGIEPGWLSLSMLHQLLCGTESKPSLINQINFSSGVKSPDSESVEISEYVTRTTVLLVHLGLVTNLGEALKLAGSIPAKQLDAFILARYQDLNPKARKQAAMDSDLKRLAEQGKLKSILDFDSVQWRDDISLEDLANGKIN